MFSERYSLGTVADVLDDGGEEKSRDEVVYFERH